MCHSRAAKYIGLLILILAVAACAPRATPSPPSPAPPPALASAPAAPRVGVTPSPEAAAWAQVEAAAKREGRVTLYQISFVGDTGPAMAKAFEGRYGIKLEFVTAIGAVSIERIKSERAAKKYSADVLNTATTLIAIAKDEGLTEAVGYLPVLAEKDKWLGPPLQDSEGHIIGLNNDLITLFVNTNLVKPGEEPRSYKELLQPKWKGKLRMDDPNTNPVPNVMYLVMQENKALDDSYFVQLGKQDLKVSPTVREGENMLARGDAHVAVTGVTSGMNRLIKEGSPVKPMDVEEGVIGLITVAVALVKNAPHPNAARLFINWLLSPEGQTIFSQGRGAQPLRKDATDFSPAAGQLVPKKTLLVDGKTQIAAARVQREKIVARLLGLEK